MRWSRWFILSLRLGKELFPQPLSGLWPSLPKLQVYRSSCIKLWYRWSSKQSSQQSLGMCMPTSQTAEPFPKKSRHFWSQSRDFQVAISVISGLESCKLLVSVSCQPPTGVKQQGTSDLLMGPEYRPRSKLIYWTTPPLPVP